MFDIRGMSYWTRKFLGKSKVDAEKFMEVELRTLRDRMEPVIARQSFVRVFEVEKFWRQRFFKKGKDKVPKLLPAEEAKKLLENTLRPPKDIFEPYIAEKSFVELYGEGIFEEVFGREPRKEPQPIEVSAADNDGSLPETPEDLIAEAKINGMSEFAEVIESADLAPDELEEAVAEYKKAQWKKKMCSKSGCRNHANGEGDNPDRCGHHKEI